MKKQPAQQAQPRRAVNQLVGGQQVNITKSRQSYYISQKLFRFQNTTFEGCCKKHEQLSKDSREHLESLQRNNIEMAALQHQVKWMQERLHQMVQYNIECLDLLSTQERSINYVHFNVNQLIELSRPSMPDSSTEVMRMHLQQIIAQNQKCIQLLQTCQRSAIRL